MKAQRKRKEPPLFVVGDASATRMALSDVPVSYDEVLVENCTMRYMIQAMVPVGHWLAA